MQEFTRLMAVIAFMQPTLVNKKTKKPFTAPYKATLSTDKTSITLRKDKEKLTLTAQSDIVFKGDASPKAQEALQEFLTARDRAEKAQSAKRAAATKQYESTLTHAIAEGKSHTFHYQKGGSVIDVTATMDNITTYTPDESVVIGGVRYLFKNFTSQNVLTD